MDITEDSKHIVVLRRGQMCKCLVVVLVLIPDILMNEQTGSTASMTRTDLC